MPRIARLRRIAVLATALVAANAAACGEIARPGAPGPSPTEPVVVNSEGLPGAAGQPLGPYTPESDVSFEVRTNAATEQLVGLLAEPSFLDWDAVREGFEATPAPIGDATPPSLSAVAHDAATGPLGARYIEHFGARDWLQQRALDAITGGGTAAALSDAERAATLSHLLSIELPLIRALVAAEAGERLTDAGDLDDRFGAPHEWDRLWVILQGAPSLNAALTDETLEAIRAGAVASTTGDTEGAARAHDTVRSAILRAALQGIASPSGDTSRAAAYLRGIEPLLSAVDPATTRDLRADLETARTSGIFDIAAIEARVAQLAERAGIEPSSVLVAS